jgi:hypothetical protein
LIIRLGEDLSHHFDWRVFELQLIHVMLQTTTKEREDDGKRVRSVRKIHT